MSYLFFVSSPTPRKPNEMTMGNNMMGVGNPV